MGAIAIARAATAAGLQRYIRDTAIRDASGFDEAWGVANNVPGYFSETNAAVFWSVIAERRPRTVVEIGSYQGRSTTVLGLALKQFVGEGAALVAIDPHTGDRQAMEALGSKLLPSLELFRLHVGGVGLSDVLQEKVASAVEAAEGWDKPVDLLFDDGWHSYEAVRDDAAAWIPHLSTRGLVCFDDYDHYDEVKVAVDEVCRKYALTLYGTVLAQAWAGRELRPPRGLGRALRISGVRSRIKEAIRRSGAMPS